MAVRLGPRGVFRRNVAQRASAVLDQHGFAEERPHLLGKEAHDDVCAAARGKTTNEVHVLGRISLRARN